MLGFIFGWVLLEADPEAIIWGQIIHLGSDPEAFFREWLCEMGNGQKPKSVQCWEVYCCGQLGLILLENSGRFYRTCLRISHPGWERGGIYPPAPICHLLMAAPWNPSDRVLQDYSRCHWHILEWRVPWDYGQGTEGLIAIRSNHQK